MKKYKFYIISAIIIFIALFSSADGNIGWWTNKTIIAHATGNIYGETYTNSYDAVIKNHAENIDVFEIDFRFSKDDIPIAVHNWSDIGLSESITHGEFMEMELRGKYRPIDVDLLIEMIKFNSDLIFIVDSKDDDDIQLFSEMINLIGKENTDYLNNIVPMVASVEQYNAIGKLTEYDLPDCVLALYKDEFGVNDSANTILNKLKGTSITSIFTSLKHDSLNKAIRKINNSIPMFYHTVNSQEVYDLIISEHQGNGVVTDLLWEWGTNEK